jgi:hypothetical protein
VVAIRTLWGKYIDWEEVCLDLQKVKEEYKNLLCLLCLGFLFMSPTRQRTDRQYSTWTVTTRGICKVRDQSHLLSLTIFAQAILLKKFN